MAWRDKLRAATFRGVSFYVDGSQYTGGRRVTFHEFPDRDNPYAEDMGRVGKTFKVEGYLLGDDYLDQKKLLIEAVDKFGPGELVHPYFGTLLVQCGAFSVDENDRDGGYAKVSFQFYDAGDNKFPKALDDKRSNLLDAANKAKSASKSAFAKAFSIAKAPGHIVDTARAGVAKAANLYQSATKGFVTIAEGVADLAFGIKNLKAEIGDLIAAPGKLADRLLDSFGLLGEAITGNREKAAAFSKFFDFGLDEVLPEPQTASRQREADNKDALDNFIREAAVCDAITASADADFSSLDEATDARNKLRDQIDFILERTQDDDVFAAFKDLNAQLVLVLPDVDAALPSVRTITLADTTPSLVLAYDLFETVEAEEDLIERNHVENPLFIPGNSEIEVLNDV